MDSVVWRGPRHNACSMAGEQAAGHLRQSLAAEGLRAVHQCCAAVMPLPVPLPFPDMFTAAGGSTAARQVCIQTRFDMHTSFKVFIVLLEWFSWT